MGRGPRRNIAMAFCVEILEWYGYSRRCKIFENICLFVLTESTNVTDRQTLSDRQTPHDGIGLGRAFA